MVPWELDELPATVVSVDHQLGRAWVEVDIDGRLEPFSLPLDALTALDEEGTVGVGEPADLDSHQVLKPLLDTIGPDRPVTVGLLVTRDEDGNRVLEVDVTMLSDDDQELPPDRVLELHDQIRTAMYEATDYEYIVVVRVGWREARTA